LVQSVDAAALDDVQTLGEPIRVRCPVVADFIRHNPKYAHLLDPARPPIPGTLPGLARLNNLVRSVRTPEFDGVTFHEVLTRSALNHVPATSAMLSGEWTINPYRGCTHACVYCFARPTHEHLGLNLGADFDRQLIVKVNLPDVLRRELATKRVLPERVAFGTNTDAYQRAEGRYGVMPPVIDALSGAGIPFSVLTKGSAIRRHLDRLSAAARRWASNRRPPALPNRRCSDATSPRTT
jgi:hypothetical protein